MPSSQQDATSQLELVDKGHPLYVRLEDLRVRHKTRLAKLAQVRALAKDREELVVIRELQRSVESRLAEIDRHIKPAAEGAKAERARSRSDSPWQNLIKFQSSDEEGDDPAKKKQGKIVEKHPPTAPAREKERDRRDRREKRSRSKKDKKSRSRNAERRPRSRSAQEKPGKPKRKSGFTDDAAEAMKNVSRPDELLPQYPTEIPSTTTSVGGRFGKTHLYLSNVQARILIGRGGVNIQKIMRDTMAQIHVNSPPQASTADVSIAGNIQPAIEMIAALLEHHGCPISKDPGAPDADAPGLLSVPDYFMGALIGPKAGLVLELQQQYGKELIVQNLGYKAPDGGEIVQVVGSRWKEAKIVIAEWLERKKAELAAASRQRAKEAQPELGPMSAVAPPAGLGAPPPPPPPGLAGAPWDGQLS